MMATVDGEGGGGGCSGRKALTVDRLSGFPDQIAHHILSSLTVFDLIRFCFVSKRCAELSLSSPYLNFDGIPSGYESSCYKRLQMMSYLEKFLFLRGNNKVQSLRLKWERHKMDENGNVCICSSEHFRLHTWINYAVMRNVKILDLKAAMYDADNAFFSSSVFVCETLRSLVLDIDFALLRMPLFGFSSNLTKLKLKYVVIEDEQFFKWISCSCKCIEELHIDVIHGIETISVESLSLKIFKFSDLLDTFHLSISGEKLENISVSWYVQPPRHSSFNVCAPNLKVFSWMGDIMNHISLGNYICLDIAALHLRPDADDVDKVYDALCSLGKVNILQLNEETIKAPFSRRSLPAPIYDIHNLGMQIGRITDEFVPAMVSLFSGLPNIFHLCIQYDPVWMVLNLMQVILCTS